MQIVFVGKGSGVAMRKKPEKDRRKCRAKKRVPAALPWVIVCCGMMLTGCGETGTEADGKSND